MHITTNTQTNLKQKWKTPLVWASSPAVTPVPETWSRRGKTCCQMLRECLRPGVRLEKTHNEVWPTKPKYLWLAVKTIFSNFPVFTEIAVAHRGVQPAARWLLASQDGCECSPAQNRKFTYNIMRFFVCVITGHNVFNVWPTTTLLPVWPRNAKRLHTPAREIWTIDSVELGRSELSG